MRLCSYVVKYDSDSYRIPLGLLHGRCLYAQPSRPASKKGRLAAREQPRFEWQ
jgi:hypothetical protein